MKNIENSLIDNVRSQTNIVDVVGEYIDIQKKGRNYWAVCPFHNDSNPSLSISEDKQIYKCFVCNAGGNVFNFVQDIEKISFVEAVKNVAQISGVEVDIKDFKESVKPKRDESLEKLFEINKKTVDFFAMQLKSENGVEALKYLNDRGIDQRQIEKFKIGLAPSNGELCKYLKALGYADIDIINAGVGREYKNGLSDSFKDRIMFAIENYQGEVFAFSGRIYKHVDEPKYINTQETKIFNKGETLYNFNNAFQAAKRNKEMIIVEGFMDVIALDRIGIENVVATMGTAFTLDHIKNLKKATNNIKLFMDSDNAGISATISMAKKLIENGLKVSIVKNENEKDADELLKAHGKDFLENLIQTTSSLTEFVIDKYIGKVKKDSAQDISKFIKYIFEFINMEKDQIQQGLYISKLSKELGVSESLLSEKLIMPEVKKVEVVKKEVQFKEPVATINKIISRYDAAEQNVLFQMFNHKEAIELFEDKKAILFGQAHRNIANYIIFAYNENKTISPADIVSLIKNKEHRDVATQIMFMDLPKEFNEKEFEENLELATKIGSKMQIEELEEKLKNTTDALEKVKLQKEILNIKKGAR